MHVHHEGIPSIKFADTYLVYSPGWSEVLRAVKPVTQEHSMLMTSAGPQPGVCFLKSLI